MDAPSTTNPIPPTGETNTSVPLGITASTAVPQVPLNAPFFQDSMLFSPKKIWIDSFTINNTRTLYDPIYEWSVRNTKLTQYLSRGASQESTILPWNLIPAYFSKQVRMEYSLLFYPVKVADCRVKIDAIVDYTDSISDIDNARDYANPNFQFQLDDPDGIIQIPVPQFYVSNNVNTDMNNFETGVLEFPAFLPRTKMHFIIANRYHNNSLQPESFKVHVFLIATPMNPQNLTGKRVSKYGVTEHPLVPYFFSVTNF